MNNLKGLFWTGDFEDYYPGHQLSEIFKERIYAPYLEDKKDAVVVDIGGNIGSFALYASKYAKQVYTVEPSAQHFPIICHMVKFNGLTNVTPLQYAIANSEGKMEFFHTQNKTMYSLLPSLPDKTDSEIVDVITIETLFKKNHIKQCDLLKLDPEGSEFEILGGEPFKNIANRIKAVVLESHSWSMRNPNQIRDSLKAAGFNVQAIPGEATLWVGTR